MTVRTAELTAAILLALASVALMWKSTELTIGWIKGSGPGGGAWPFWLSAGMLVCSLVTIVRWFMRVTPESRSKERYMDRPAVKVVGTSVAAIFSLLLATHVIGIYFSLVLFLIFFVRVMGQNSWTVTISLAIATPAFLFCFFEWALKIPLPKAYAEPLFYPLYDLIY